MPDIIDSLVVLLNLDASQFTQGQKDALTNLRKTEEGAARIGKSIEASGKQAASFFTNMRDGALGLFAVLLGGKEVLDFARDSADSVSALGRAAHDMGMSAQDLGSFNAMIQAAGGGAEDATVAFGGLSQAIAQIPINGPSANLVQFFRAISGFGASPNSSQGQIYEAFNRWAQGQDPQRVKVIGHLAGYSNAMIDLAEKPVADFQKRLADAQKLTPYDPKTVENLTNLQHAFRNLDQELLKTSTDILNRWGPALTAAANGTVKLLGDNQKLTDGIAEVGSAFLALEAISKTAKWLGFKALSSILDGLLLTATKLTVVLGLPLFTAGDTPGGYKDMTPAQRAAAAAKAKADADAFNKMSPADQAKAVAMARAKDDAAASAAGASWWHNLFHGGAAPGPQSSAPVSATPSPQSMAQKESFLTSIEKSVGLPHGLLDAVWSAESHRGKALVSKKGALGDFQFKAAAAHDYHVTDPFNFEMAAKGAGAYLAHLYKKYGDIRKALAAFNWGPTNIDKDIAANHSAWFAHVPPETMKYVNSVTSGLGAVGQQSNNVSNSKSVAVNINNQHIHTQATDSAGIARSMFDDLVAQANYGLA